MVKRMLCLVAALLILTAGASFAAAPPRTPQSRAVKVFMGTFVNPSGGTHRFQVPDGGYINIKNKKQGLYYRLSAKTGKDGAAEITLQQYTDADYSAVVSEDRMNMVLDGTAKQSAIAPFRFSLDGQRTARAEQRSGTMPFDMIGGFCCIDCGDGWEVCCGVMIFEPGWLACCSIDTSCAWCEVCAWWTE
jgi:hypothetical protein